MTPLLTVSVYTFNMNRRSFAVLVGLLIFVACSWGQTISNMRLTFEVGDQGLAHTLILRLEIIGGTSGREVLATSDFNPPEPDGLAHGGPRLAAFTLDREVSIRMIKQIKLTVRGDRPGQDITTGFRFSNLTYVFERSGRVEWPHRIASPVLMNRSNPSWTSPVWNSYDPRGLAQGLNSLSLRVVTGGDDLRNDSSAGAYIMFRSGRVVRIDIGRSGGIAGRTERNFTIPVSRDESFGDITQVHLFKSIFVPLHHFEFRTLSLMQKPTNADKWDVDRVELIGEASNVGRLTQVMPSLAGTYGSDVKRWQSSNQVIMHFSSRSGFPMSRLIVLLDDEKHSYDNSPDNIEVHAFVRLRGSREFVAYNRRANESQRYILNTPESFWKGWDFYMNGREYGGSHQNCVIYADKSLPGGLDNPIEEIRLSIYNGPKIGPGGWVYQSYRGPKQIKVRGVILAATTPVRDSAFHLLQGFKVLGLELTRPAVLSQSSRDVTYRLNYSLKQP